MAFNKFDPHRQDPEPPAWRDGAGRRALLLKYAWWVSAAQVALGFAFIAYWLLSGRAA